MLRDDPESNHEYLSIRGLDTFLSAAQKLLLGADSLALQNNRVRHSERAKTTQSTMLTASRSARFKPFQARAQSMSEQHSSLGFILDPEAQEC